MWKLESIRFATIILFAMLLLAAGCRNKESNVDEPPAAVARSVVAVCYPLEFLTQRIAGDALDVRCAVPAGEDADSWRPKRDDISRMQAADLIVTNGRGAEYASWMTIASIPDSKLCESATKGLSLKDYIAVEDVQVVHSHGPEGEHSHPTMVAYTWLDPATAEKQAKYITQELARVYPDLANQFNQNFSQLKSELDQLSDSINSLKESGLTVITTNPKLKFLTRAAGIQDQHLNWISTPTLEQAASDLAKIKPDLPSTAKTDEAAPFILLTSIPVDKQFEDWLSEQNIKHIAINPLDAQPETGDYLSVMKENIEHLRRMIAEQ